MSLELLTNPIPTTDEFTLSRSLKRPQESYGVGNPVPLVDLSPDTYQTTTYLKGQDLYKRGQTPITDAAFIQIMGLKGGTRLVDGKEVPYEVATISRDLVWDGETPIEAFGEALASELAGRQLKPEWFGPYQFTAYIEGDLDLNQLVQKFVYSPPKIYAQHMPNLLAEAEKDVKHFEQDILTADYAKGLRFINIFRGKSSGQQTAFQEGEGRGFAWGYIKTDTDELAAINLDGGGQTITELANSEWAMMNGGHMRESLLETQEFFKGVKGHQRWVIRFTFDPTRNCCIYATAAQSSLFLNEGSGFSTSFSEFKINKPGITDDGILQSDLTAYILREKQKQERVCSSCKKEKGSSDKDKQCSCNQKAA